MGTLTVRPPVIFFNNNPVTPVANTVSSIRKPLHNTHVSQPVRTIRTLRRSQQERARLGDRLREWTRLPTPISYILKQAMSVSDWYLQETMLCMVVIHTLTNIISNNK
jgi:hypothetical protein